MVKKAIRYLRVDPWLIEEEGFHSLRGCVSESVFSLANEFMGVRGYFEEGYSGESIAGSYFNGIFERFFIDHPVRHRGMADEEQKMLNSVDWLYLRLELDGEVLDLAKSKFSDFKRTLDMRTGLLRRSFVWKTPKGKKLGLRFERFISMAEPNLACQRITFEPLNFSGSVKVLTGLDFTLVHHNTSGFISEPIESLWQQEKSGRAGGVSAISAKVPNSGHRIFSSYRLLCGQKIKEQKITEEKFVGSKFSLKLTKGESLGLEKVIVNCTEKRSKIKPIDFWRRSMKKVKGFGETSFDVALEKHKKYWEHVWRDLDIVIDGDKLNQQGIRFCIFNLHQTYHGMDASLNVAAKGLSGDGYDGKTWWDSETYCLPFYLFNNQAAAKNLLEYRYKTLGEAKKRAKVVDDCRGGEVSDEYHRR